MKQEVFENQYQHEWKRLNHILLSTENSKTNKEFDIKEVDIKELPQRYRQICHHYSLAKHRHYSPRLVEQLHELMLRAYRQIYKPRYSILQVMGELLLKTFPQSLRKHWKLFAICFGLFYIPMLGMGIACYLNPDLIYLVMEPDAVREMEYMYNPENDLIGRNTDQETASRVYMFGYYINNNIGIGLRCFAGGITFGLFTILVLLLNGFVIGAVGGYLTNLGYIETFWSFVPGHSGFELNAIVIAGVAGMLLAKALIFPGQYSRKDALMIAGKESSSIIFGASLMLLIAAAIEAFWSPTRAVSLSMKMAIGLATWVLLYWYFIRAGRHR